MKKTTVVRLRGIRLVDAINQNNTLIVMLAILIAGMIFGALRIKSGGNLLSSVAEGFTEYLGTRKSTQFVTLLLKSCCVWLPFFFALFLCGTSLTGIAVTPFIVGAYGYVYGIVTAYLYKTYSLTGIGFSMLIILPARLVSSFALMLAGREALGFSVMMAKVTLQSANTGRAYSSFKNYCLHFLFILLILTVSALIDCMFSACFIRFFGF